MAPGLPVPGLPDPLGAEDDSMEEAFAPEELDALMRSDGAEAPSIRPGSRCSGVIVAISESGAIISFGAKVEGLVPQDEFRGPDGELSVEPGQKVEVIVEKLGAPGAFAVLSYKRAREALAWKDVAASHARNIPMQARIVARVKGGLRVDVGVAAFLPASQVDLRPVRNLDAWVGRSTEVVVVEFNRSRSNVVVSRRELLKARRRVQQRETLSRIEVGGEATGVVKNITSYGVFVDLGGIDGLIKLKELSYGRVGNPSDLYRPGQELKAKVLRIDTAKERVALSLRLMAPDPWLTVEERFPPGEKVRGRVTSVTDYGAFVELESGVEGLIHSSEIAWSRHRKHPSKTFKPGDETEAVVLSVNPADRRISLSFKRLDPDPWDQFGGELEVEQIVTGTVRRIKEYGLFVELFWEFEGGEIRGIGIEGLVHVSELSWDTRVRNARGFARKGDQINAVILHIDREKRRLSLGVKQLEPDMLDTFLGQYTVGDTVPGLVRRIVKFGAFVELAPGVEGLCHNSQMPRGKRALKTGQRYYFTILQVDERARRIALRCLKAVPVADEQETAAPSADQA